MFYISRVTNTRHNTNTIVHNIEKERLFKYLQYPRCYVVFVDNQFFMWEGLCWYYGGCMLSLILHFWQSLFINLVLFTVYQNNIWNTSINCMLRVKYKICRSDLKVSVGQQKVTLKWLWGESVWSGLQQHLWLEDLCEVLW